MPKPHLDSGAHVGHTYGRLLITGWFRGNKYYFLKCVCLCERKYTGREDHILSGRVVSCGCHKDEKAAERNRTHGASGTPIHNIWLQIVQRCCNQKRKAYDKYGGRGITICNRWRGDFTAFRDDMGPRPTPKHSVDRIDNDKGYWCGGVECPDCGPAGREPNCRWATRGTQARNTRTNVNLTFGGKSQCLAAWSSEMGIPESTLRRWVRVLGVDGAMGKAVLIRKSK